jgi:hypothetical protein
MAQEKRIDLFLRGHDQASGVVRRTTGTVVGFTGAVKTATAALGTLLAPFIALRGILEAAQVGAEFEKTMDRPTPGPHDDLQRQSIRRSHGVLRAGRV